LHDLRRERPDLRMVVHDIERDADALQRLKDLAARERVPAVGVPAFHVRDQLVVGFLGPETTGARLRDLIRGVGEPTRPEVAESCPAQPNATCEGSERVERISFPFFGSIAAGEIGLPLFTIAIGLLDGFNPCAMWVLLFLLSLLVNVHDRRKMLVIAGTFVVASGVVYFAFMAAWLNIFVLIGYSAAVRTVLGIAAAGVGAANVKDFFAPGRGISFSIPDAAKPRIYGRARHVLQAGDLSGALSGVIVLAVLANVVELLCTAGFPAVYTHILTLRELPWWEYYGYLALYNTAYMLDDGVMVLASVITLDRFKLQQRGGRWLKLVSGAVLIGLGSTLLFKPDWLAFSAP
jgi:hypothetical protein